jgi:hypothetical protein
MHSYEPPGIDNTVQQLVGCAQNGDLVCTGVPEHFDTTCHKALLRCAAICKSRRDRSITRGTRFMPVAVFSHRNLPACDVFTTTKDAISKHRPTSF